MEAFDQTKKGIGHAIEEGRQTNFWTHRWIDDKPLIDLTMRNILDDHLGRHVHEMGWDWDQLVLFLLYSISQRITSFLLMKEEVGDNLIWTAGKLGIFSIKSALAIISSEHSAKEDRDYIGNGFGESKPLKEFVHLRGLSSTKNYSRMRRGQEDT
ncbi:hypothetical protein Cgig2_033573 [Carnegiea gigantea]|uniref:Uncharacterized protein n=1 Tax=Carnegiea gigantea TaxID=171969 RepID=A0A9Q1KNX2_9CARY|nr:hypothetical protein Cgig2_033573 [Carnegiea gigantea]